MLSIKPGLYQAFICPKCQSKNLQQGQVLWQGIHFFVENECKHCGYTFIVNLPAGHGILYPIVIGKEDLRFWTLNPNIWFQESAYQSYLAQNTSEIKIERRVFEYKKDVIILNCLDYLYGHSLLKLFNACQYTDKYPDLGLIIIVPPNLVWLIPQGVAELWIVSIGFSKMREWYTSLSTFFSKQIQEYQEIHLSLAYTHPNPVDWQVERYVGVKPFDLANFERQEPFIGFVVREDRLWAGFGMEHFLFLACRKLQLFDKLPIIKKFFLYFQRRRIVKTFQKIKKYLPATNFYLVGLGTELRFPKWIQDHRSNKVDAEKERKWCDLYSKSHLMMGIHGSNMILPTALSASFVELLPKDRWGNLSQDIANHHPNQLQQFLGRFISEFSSAHALAGQVISIFQHFQNFYKQNNPSFQPYREVKDISEIF